MPNGDGDTTDDDGGGNACSCAWDTQIGVGDAFDLLQAPRRRWMLDYLRDNDGDVATLQTIAEHVQKRQRPHEATTNRPLTDVYVELYHTHVPRLDRVDIASYDQEDDTVSLEELPKPVPTLLDVANELERTREND